MHAKGTKQVRESAAVSDCTKISCVRKVGEPRIRKLSAYEIFWIYSIYFVLSKFYVTLNSSFMMINEKAAGNDCLSLLAGISYQINHSC